MRKCSICILMILLGACAHEAKLEQSPVTSNSQILNSTEKNQREIKSSSEKLKVISPGPNELPGDNTQPAGIAQKPIFDSGKSKGLIQDDVLVHKLLYESTAAKNIRSSENEQALRVHDKAKLLYREAKEAKSAGDTQRQQELLRNAKLTFFQAARFAQSNHIEQQDIEQSYHKRLESTRVLLSALQRISEEKGVINVFTDVEPKVRKRLLAAQAAYRSANLQQAEKLAREAYLTVRRSIINLRDGDTLIHTLHFASAKEEYEYELKRNDTHNLLLDVVFKNITSSLSDKTRVTQFLDKSISLRLQAEQQAHTTQYKSAIKILEKSTQQIIRAIRVAGIYIPG